MKEFSPKYSLFRTLRRVGLAGLAAGGLNAGINTARAANLPRPDITAPQNQWTRIPAGEICLGDVKVHAGRIFNTVYDNSDRTAMIIETTAKADTILVAIKPPFGTVYCYPDSRINLELLKRAGQTVNGQYDRRIIVDVIPEPSNRIQPRRILTTVTAAVSYSPTPTTVTAPSLQYPQGQFTLPTNYEVLADLKCLNKEGQMEQTADGTGTTATLVQANEGVSVTCENDYGSGWMLPINTTDTQQLESQAGKPVRFVSVPQN